MCWWLARLGPLKKVRGHTSREEEVVQGLGPEILSKTWQGFFFFLHDLFFLLNSKGKHI